MQKIYSGYQSLILPKKQEIVLSSIILNILNRYILEYNIYYIYREIA